MIEDPTAAILNGTSAEAQEWVSVATQPLDLSDLRDYYTADHR